MQVTVHKAKTDLSKLIDAALNGEEVVIAKGKAPAVKLVPVEETRFISGVLKGIVPPGGPDFLEPMSEDELKDWEGA